jgi:hypothetical protein
MVVKLEHAYQDLETWREVIDQQLQRMQKTVL